MTLFQTAIEHYAEIDAFEVRLPSQGDAEAHIDELRGFSAVDVFAEINLDGSFSDTVAICADADWMGLKARVNGSVQAEIPSPVRLADFIWECASLEVPFKVGDGLDRAFSTTRGRATDYGFINLAVATALALTADLAPNQIAQLLASGPGNDWQFDANGLQWREFRLTLDQIDESRSIFAGFNLGAIENLTNTLQPFPS
jgi:hypothetical protein